MAQLLHLSSSNVSDTFHKLVQTQGGKFSDGSGSVIHFVTANQTASMTVATASYAISASHEIIYELSSSYAETASYVDTTALDTFKQTGMRSGDGFITGTGSIGHIISTGSIYAHGNISASGNIYADDYYIENVQAINYRGVSPTRLIYGTDAGTAQKTIITAGNYGIELDSNVTASGNISSSGDISTTGNSHVGGHITASGNIKAGGYISSSGNVYGTTYWSSGKVLFLYAAPTNLLIMGDASAKAKLQGINIELAAPVTASGNISSSGDIYANAFYANGVGVAGYTPAADLLTLGNASVYSTQINGSNINLEGQVTASGNVKVGGYISASGDIVAIGNISASGAVSGGIGTHVLGGFLDVRHPFSGSSIKTRNWNGYAVNNFIGRNVFGSDGVGTVNIANQFYNSEGYTNFFGAFEADGEEVMKGGGTVAGGNLLFEFGDVGGADNNVIFKADVGNARFDFEEGYVDIHNTSDATTSDGDSGALRVEGGVSVGKLLYAASISSSGFVNSRKYNVHVAGTDNGYYIAGNRVLYDNLAGTTALVGGNNLGLSAPSNITLDAEGVINLDAAGKDINFKRGGNTTITFNTAIGHISASGEISGSTLRSQDASIIGTASFGYVTAPQISASGTVTAMNYQIAKDGARRQLFSEVDDAIQWGEQTITKYRIGKAGGVVTNEFSINSNISASGTISSSGNIFAPKVHIGNHSLNTTYKLDIGDEDDNTHARIYSNAGNAGLIIRGNSTANSQIAFYEESDKHFTLGVQGSTDKLIISSGSTIANGKILEIDKDGGQIRVNTFLSSSKNALFEDVEADELYSKTDVIGNQFFSLNGYSFRPVDATDSNDTRGWVDYVEGSIRIVPNNVNTSANGTLVVSSSGGTATSNARVGIGTETPTEMLTVGGTGVEGNISASGYVRTPELVGEGSGNARLEISGSITLSSSLTPIELTTDTLHVSASHLHFDKSIIGGYFPSESIATKLGTIKIPPTAFMDNDDTSLQRQSLEDDSNTYGMKIGNVSDELYAYVEVPHGWKATKYTAYASQDRTTDFIVVNITTGAGTTDGTSGTCNAQTTLSSAFTPKWNTYALLKVNLTSTSDVLYGALVTIERI